MRLTNFLLLILICLIASQNIPSLGKKEKNVPIPRVTINAPKEYKSVKAEVEDKNNIKHSTTFRNYIDSDGRANQGISHNIRIGKDYYLSNSLDVRETSFGQQSFGVSTSITKWW